MMKRVKDLYRWMQRLSLLGDAGLGLLVAVVFCLGLYLTGRFEEAIFGVPMYLGASGAIGVGVTLVSHVAGWMPDLEQTPQSDAKNR